MKIKIITTVLLVSILLSSCAPGTAAPAPTATAIPTATTEPTITPTPIPTINVEGQVIPDPHFSNPDLFDLNKANAPIPQITHALSMAGVEVTAQVINESLTYKLVQAKNGDMYVVMLTTDIPATPYDEGNIPLLLYSKDLKTGLFSWIPVYLQDVAGLHEILIGAVWDSADDMDLNQQNGMFTNNFNLATIAWSSVDVSMDLEDHNTQYRLSRLANENVQEVMWFHLSESGDSPVFTSEDEAVAFINNEMDDVVKKYGAKMTIVSVLNELNPPNTSYQMWKRFGDSYLIRIFQHVREILPDAKIIYNESYNWSRNFDGSLYPYTAEVVKVLKENNLIDAVGMQMHMAYNSWGLQNKFDIDEAVSIMQEFGLPVYVTELDVNQTPMSGTDQQKLIQQAKMYEDVVRACVRSGVCQIINFWGQADPYSWYVFALNEPDSKACIFDDNGTPKLAYYAVLRGLLEGY